MTKFVGSKVWFIPDGFLNSTSKGEAKSHEAICVLNTSDKDAEIEITLYFEDKNKMAGFRAKCPAERTNHIRMDRIVDENGRGVPWDTPYAAMVSSDTEIIVQYSRLDSSQEALSLMTTIAYPLK